ELPPTGEAGPACARTTRPANRYRFAEAWFGRPIMNVTGPRRSEVKTRFGTAAAPAASPAAS
ncbi:MAG: hypothetical protein WKF64_13170, partial [Ilumatobacteraceae bacterium]